MLTRLVTYALETPIFYNKSIFTSRYPRSFFHPEELPVVLHRLYPWKPTNKRVRIQPGKWARRTPLMNMTGQGIR